ncbi:MAG TPA: AAA family ATPase [Streptosporangiaceae bacterium]|nr:AAA family ATPase [Streptosporangiaceae bacterium]
MEAGLIGRDAERERLRGLVDPAPARSQVLVVRGDAGLGKTALLADAAAQARRAGLRVLSVTGTEAEQDLAFAGLHQLLRPVLDRAADLPERQAKALLGALALSEDPVPPDALLTGIAVLTLLSDLSGQGPLLVLADDAQWLDRGSLGTLAFTARRLAAEPVVLLLAARGSVPLAGFGPDELVLAPLGARDATRLLDVQPRPPRGRARELVLAQADGNPMALIELARVIAADPAAARRWAAEPLPPTDRLAAIVAGEFAALPAATRDALLLVAVAGDGAGPPTLPGLTAAALAPAEAAGLIRVDTGWPRFRHPLVRSAAYHGVPFAERAAAHRRVAEALRDQPDRYAWHLAAAALGPDERVAALLERSAAGARRRGGTAAAARALECAAELSAHDQDRARRLLAAAELAVPTGQADWVSDLAGRVLAVSTDPQERSVARLYAGWALVWSSRPADALATLLSLTADGAPGVAWTALGLAGIVAYQTGGQAARDAVLDALDRLEPQTRPGAAPEVRSWVRASAGPFGRKRTQGVADLRGIDRGSVTDLATWGAAAWVLDETELSVALLREAISRLRAAGVGGRNGGALSALEWACIDSGRWDDALAAAREASDTAAAYLMPTVAASADLAAATVFALRGELDRSGAHLASARAAVDLAEYRSYAARARHAAGLAALAEGGYAAAYAQLEPLFAGDGTPLHHHVSYLAVADLAAAAVRAERRDEARIVIERALARMEPGPRLAQLAARARGLLAGAARAGDCFEAVRPQPAWPFEQAQLQLDHGAWLRRQRRINEAKPVLAAALEVFRRLGAAPWARRAEAELRACGVSAQAAAAGALDSLTPQQREIVILASQGLTNGEIAGRLFLSPRTVASHLYRVYPKLGIAGRHQLRDLVDRA